MSIKRGLIHIN